MSRYQKKWVADSNLRRPFDSTRPWEEKEERTVAEKYGTAGRPTKVKIRRYYKIFSLRGGSFVFHPLSALTDRLCVRVIPT